MDENPVRRVRSYGDADEVLLAAHFQAGIGAEMEDGYRLESWQFTSRLSDHAVISYHYCLAVYVRAS